MTDEKAPDLKLVRSIMTKYLGSDFSITPVQKGHSTFVYRISLNADILYLRILPEEGSFGSEVLAHNLLRKAGVTVPRIIVYEDRNEHLERSFMLVSEIPGESIEDELPQTNLDEIMREAGRQLARIHSINVDGFGWIDKKHTDVLKGEKSSFDDFYTEHLDDDLKMLNQYSFTDNEKLKLEEYMIVGRRMLDVKAAVLVHGDFDISHIFSFDGRYSGIIDFGEIRGNTPLYDLATFIGFYQDREVYAKLLEGYFETHTLSDAELCAVELMALFVILRFLGKKANTASREHWFGLARKQLLEVERALANAWG